MCLIAFSDCCVGVWISAQLLGLPFGVKFDYVFCGVILLLFAGGGCLLGFGVVLFIWYAVWFVLSDCHFAW